MRAECSCETCSTCFFLENVGRLATGLRRQESPHCCLCTCHRLSDSPPDLCCPDAGRSWCSWASSSTCSSLSARQRQPSRAPLPLPPPSCCCSGEACCWCGFHPDADACAARRTLPSAVAYTQGPCLQCSESHAAAHSLPCRSVVIALFKDIPDVAGDSKVRGAHACTMACAWTQLERQA